MRVPDGITDCVAPVPSEMTVPGAAPSAAPATAPTAASFAVDAEVGFVCSVLTETFEMVPSKG
jgi:hypothetical protein